MTENTCKTCRWARFRHYKNNKIDLSRYGFCEYTLPPITVLPVCITSSIGYMPLTEKSKNVIWSDTSDCPVWESKETK